MSTALEKLSTTKNLRDIWEEFWPKAKNSSPGVDLVTPKEFDDNLTKHIALIRAELKQGYKFSLLRGVSVPKKDPTKFRIICVPTIQDRIIQKAVLKNIETKAKKLRIANDVSFGFVKETQDIKRGATAARIAAIKHRQNNPWAFKADISAFFDRIPRHQLIESFENSFSLKSLLPLVRDAINCEVDASNPRIRRILDENDIRVGRGLRQGMPLSPILSNFLLRDFDHAFIARRYDMVRYADDLVVFASSLKECEAIRDLTISELANLNLEVSPSKTEICSPETPVEFLGMELGIKQGTSAYCLTVSDAQIRKIREQFVNYHDIENVIRDKLNVFQLLRRLENMKSGYRAAYGVADNFKELDQHLNQWATNCISKLYSSIFGSDVMGRLTGRQKTFLMLP